MILRHFRAIRKETFVEMDVTEKKQKEKCSTTLFIANKPTTAPNLERKRNTDRTQGAGFVGKILFSSSFLPDSLIQAQVASFSYRKELNPNKDQR